MEHIKTLNTKNLQNTVKKGGCGECQTSCQSACKTSCTVGTRAASTNKKQPLNEWKAAGDPLLHLFYLKVTGIQQNAPEGAFCRVIKEF